MDSSLLLGVVGIVVSAAVAYHIAARQGAFNVARARLQFGRPANGHGSGGQPWAVFVALKDEGAETYVLDLPIAVSVRGAALRNVWLQAAYPKGRHASDVIPVSLQSGTHGESFRAVHLGPFTLAESTVPIVNRDSGLVVADLVAWRAADLQPTQLQAGEGERVNAPSVAFNWTADRVTIAMRAENHPAIDLETWLVAFTYTDRQSMDDAIALTSEALMRRDGIPVKSGAPGSRVMYFPKHARTGLLVNPEFKKRHGAVAISHIADDAREVTLIDLTPVRNKLSPRLIDQTPNRRVEPTA